MFYIEFIDISSLNILKISAIQKFTKLFNKALAICFLSNKAMS